MKNPEKFNGAFASMFFIGLIGAGLVHIFLKKDDHFALLIITLAAMLPKVIWELFNAASNIMDNAVLATLRLLFFYGSFFILSGLVFPFLVCYGVLVMGIPAIFIAVVGGFLHYKKRKKHGE